MNDRSSQKARPSLFRGSRPFILIALLLVVGALLSSAATSRAQEVGTNWTAEYFNNATLAGTPVFTTVIPAGINFNYGAAAPPIPVTGFPADNFSIRFNSTQFFNPGTYTFTVRSDDGVRVYINNALVLDRFFGRVLTTDQFQQIFPGGAVQIRVEYLELVDQAILEFSWQLGGVGGTPPVGTFLFTPTFGPSPTPTTIPPTALPPIPPGALTGTVIRATVLLARDAPYFGAPVVSRLRRGQTYAVVGRDPDARWFLLQLSERQAWVWGYYVFVNGNEFNAPVVGSFVTRGDPAANSPLTVVSEATLRLRAEPDVLSAQIGRVPWGDILPVIGRTGGGDWYQVVFRGTVGWVASGFVRVVDGDPGAVPVVR